MIDEKAFLNGKVFSFMGLNLIPFYGQLMDLPLTSPGDPRPKRAGQSHVLIYGAIEAHDYGDKGCIASNKTIAEETGLSVSRVASIISELAGGMWVQVNLNGIGQRTSIQPLLTLVKTGYKPLPNLATPLPNLATPLAKRGNREHILDNSKEKDNTSTLRDDQSDSASLQAPTVGDSSDSFKEGSAAAQRAEGLKKIFDVLTGILHPGQKMLYTETRKRKLERRLENFKASQIVESARNLSRSEFHMGKNDQKTKYATYDFLMKNDEKVEEWLNKKPVNKPKSVF